MPLALLALALAGVAWLFRRQGRPIPRAAADGKSEAPRTRFRTWLRTAVPLFLLQPLMGLALLGRVDGIVHLPPEFTPLAFGSLDDQSPLDLVEMIATAVAAMLATSISSAFVSARRQGRLRPLGDLSSLLPRSRGDVWEVALLGASAGVVEEVFFRLYLPLLLVMAGMSAMAAFAAAVLPFALLHRYQGWIGVIVAGLVGLVITYLYLATSTLVVPMFFHAMVNFNVLVVRPWLVRRFAPKPR